jgi:hypothetical protein
MSARTDGASKNTTPADVRAFTRNFYVGPICYTVAFLLALVSGIASLALILAVAVFFAVETRSPRRSETRSMKA